jgi:TPR repeat protein
MKHICALIMLVVAGPVLVCAQKTKPAPKAVELKEKRTEKQIQDDLKRVAAIGLVERTAAEAPLWDNKKTAVEVLVDAADLLWDENPPQSAKWLLRAWSLIDQVSDAPSSDHLKDFFTRSERVELQTAVLIVARRRDPELAEKFLAQLAEKKSDEKKGGGAFDDRTARSEQLLRLAQQAVDANPELAFTLAERSLADGLSYSLQDVLARLHKTRVDLAGRLFDLSLARFGSFDTDPSEAEVLAGYLFQSGFTFSANASGQTIMVVNPSQQSEPPVAPREPQRARGFLTAVYQGLLARPVSLDTPEGRQRCQQILVLGRRLAGPYYTFAPELAPSAQGFLAQLQHQLSPDGEAASLGGSSQASATNGNSTKSLTGDEIYEKHLTELEDKADHENDPIARKLAYLRAALTVKTRDYQRARRTAEKIADDDLRADVVSFVLYRAALLFAEKSETETALEIAPQISDGQRRAMVRITIAQCLLAKSEKTHAGELSLGQQRAFELLSDSEQDLKKEEPSVNTVKIQLGRAAVLAQLDKARALLALEQAVQMINKLDKFNLRDGSAPDLSLGVSAASAATVSTPKLGFDFRSAINPLICSDFEEIKAVADRLTAKDVNGVGHLEVAKLYLRQNNDFARKVSAVRTR